MARNVTKKELRNLLEVQGFVCINTDKGYSKEKQNSLQDYFEMTGEAAKTLKKHPIVQAILEEKNVINIVDDESDDYEVTTNNNNSETVVNSPVAETILETI
jgi:hypothetical protein